MAYPFALAPQVAIASDGLAAPDVRPPTILPDCIRTIFDAVIRAREVRQGREALTAEPGMSLQLLPVF